MDDEDDDDDDDDEAAVGGRSSTGQAEQSGGSRSASAADSKTMEQVAAESPAADDEKPSSSGQAKTAVKQSKEIQLPSGGCRAFVQVKGKGKFVEMELELLGGKLAFKSVATKKKKSKGAGQILREANVFGCEVATPKSARKGHTHSFRLDLANSMKDTKGDSKYIVSMGSADLLGEWMEYLRAYAAGGVA
jgi:hypothetical protein